MWIDRLASCGSPTRPRNAAARSSFTSSSSVFVYAERDSMLIESAWPLSTAHHKELRTRSPETGVPETMVPTKTSRSWIPGLSSSVSIAHDEAFRGAGPQVLRALEADEVFAALVPGAAARFIVSAASGCEDVSVSVENLEPGEVVSIDAPLLPGGSGCADPSPWRSLGGVGSHIEFQSESVPFSGQVV